MADQPDQSVQVSDFCVMTGATPELATQYLEANDWDMMAATNSYFHDDDERKLEQRGEQSDQVADENYTGPRTLDGRPAPQASSSRSSRKQAAQPKKRGVSGIATLGSLGGGSHSHDDEDESDEDFDDDEDDDGRGNLFAGGEKSGLAVQDPKQEGGSSKKIIGDILAKAKANTSRPDASTPETELAGPSRFRGTGMTLGGDGVESRSIPDPLGPNRPSNVEPQERILHLWHDGFSIDDGELRRFDDPANMADLQLIRQGRAPLHLMNVTHDAPVDVKLQQHDSPYQEQPKKYKPFSGSGHRLGSPVPGADGEGSSSLAAVAAQATPAPSAAMASSSNAPAPEVDNSQPTVMIRIQLPDGTRLPARFNTTNTVGDIYGFVQGASPETRTRPWVLATTFPNKDHTDKTLVIGDMAEFKKGGTAVVKWT